MYRNRKRMEIEGGKGRKEGRERIGERERESRNRKWKEHKRHRKKKAGQESGKEEREGGWWGGEGGRNWTGTRTGPDGPGLLVGPHKCAKEAVLLGEQLGGGVTLHQDARGQHQHLLCVHDGRHQVLGGQIGQG